MRTRASRERAPVRRPAAEPVSPSQLAPVWQLYRWRSVKKQKGDFIGDPAAFHIHAVAGNEHFKYGTDPGSRVDYMFKNKVNQDQVRVAIGVCTGLVDSKARRLDETCKAECLERMNELLDEDTTVPEVETKVEDKPAETSAPTFTGASPYGPVDKSKYEPPSEDDFL